MNPVAGPRPKGSSRVVLCLKALVAVLTCAWILSLADWGDVARALPNVSVPGVAAATVLMFLSVPFSAYKWKLLLQIHDARYPLATLTRYYFVAGFFNNFLPSGIGGDGYRVYKTFRTTRSPASAFIAVIMERVTGLLALLVLAWISSIVIYADAGDTLSGAIALIGGLSIALSIVAVACGRWTGLGRRLVEWLRGWHLVNVVLTQLEPYRSNTRPVLRVVMLSFLFHVHALAFYALLLFSVGGTSSVFELTVAVAATAVASILPLSLNGLGIMDGAFVFMMVHYGVGYEHALLTIVLWRAIVAVISAVGGIIYGLGRDERVAMSPGSTADAQLPGGR